VLPPRQVSDAAGATLCAAIGGNASLRTLSLRRNCLSQAGPAALGRALLQNTSLREV